MATFKEKCEKFFGSSNYYEILGVEKTVTDKQLKKAYRTLSLRIHPDKVGDDEKTEATEKFKLLEKIHSVLQDTEQRKKYDSDLSSNWMCFFRRITTQELDNFKAEYIGSDMEQRDIKKAYVGSKGNLDHIFRTVSYLQPEDEPRVIEMIRKLVDDGEVEEYDRFFNEPKTKKDRRRIRMREEAEEAARIIEENTQAEQRRQESEQQFNKMATRSAKKNTKTKPKPTLRRGRPKSTRSKK